MKVSKMKFLGINWLIESIEHIEICQNYNCEWYHATLSFLRENEIGTRPSEYNPFLEKLRELS